MKKEYYRRMIGIDAIYNNLAIIFECKNCKTILSVAHIKEMSRFYQWAVDDPAWGKTCQRN